MNAECDWDGHQDAMDEAGCCPVCGAGDLDLEWAARNGVDLSDGPVWP